MSPFIRRGDIIISEHLELGLIKGTAFDEKGTNVCIFNGIEQNKVVKKGNLTPVAVGIQNINKNCIFFFIFFFGGGGVGGG
jgi:hypothetical protein